MADRPLKMKVLRRILTRYGVSEDPSMGKGSHTTFYKRIGNGVFTYPVPTDNSPVLMCYVKGCRKKWPGSSQGNTLSDAKLAECIVR